MGTDIHMYIERRRQDGSWRVLAPPEPPPESERSEQRTRHDNGQPYTYVSPFWGPSGCFYICECYGARTEDGDEEGCKGKECPACLGTSRDLRWYHNRNYNVFAILSGTVRNGTGFAGVKTGGGFRGIVPEPRGLPDDASETVAKFHSWDHSEGWLTLDEVLAFDWEQSTATLTGALPLVPGRDGWGHDDCYRDWRDRKPRAAPKSWSGGVSGRDIHTVDMPTADRILAAMAEGRVIDIDTQPDDMDLNPAPRWRRPKVTSAAPNTFYVQVSWGQTYAECARSFLDFVDQYLVPLGEPKDTRLVFGFDS